MTNWEKFKEVFGIPDDGELEPTGTVCSLVSCNNMLCSECLICKCGMAEWNFWKREYKAESLEQEPCEMTAEEYRQKLMQVFHNVNFDELIALCVLPTEKEFKRLEWLLKNHYKQEEPCEEWLMQNYYKQESCEDCISRADALRVAKNEYLRGWHNALCKALSEKYSIHCEEGNFTVIQEEAITGLGLSMDCAVGKDVESYMSALPSVTPTQKWTPTSEKLPRKNEFVGNVAKHYLIQDEFGDMQVAAYTNRGWVPIHTIGAFEYDVVAWMPLPEPYKAESEEEDDNR